MRDLSRVINENQVTSAKLARTLLGPPGPAQESMSYLRPCVSKLVITSSSVSLMLQTKCNAMLPVTIGAR